MLLIKPVYQPKASYLNRQSYFIPPTLGAVSDGSREPNSQGSHNISQVCTYSISTATRKKTMPPKRKREKISAAESGDAISPPISRKKTKSPKKISVLPATLACLVNPDAEVCIHCGNKPLSDSLYRTISSNHKSCFDALLHQVSEGGTKTATTLVDAPNQWGNRPLHYACSYNRMYFVKALVTVGANPSSGPNENSSPLSWSCGNVGVAKFLIFHCGVRVTEQKSNSCSMSESVLDRARIERSRGKTYAAWSDVIESAAKQQEQSK